MLWYWIKCNNSNHLLIIKPIKTSSRPPPLQQVQELVAGRGLWPVSGARPTLQGWSVGRRWRGEGRAPDKMHRAAEFLSEKSPIPTTRWRYPISVRASQQQIHPQLTRGKKETNESFSALNDSH